MASREKVEKLMELTGGKKIFQAATDQSPFKQMSQGMGGMFGMSEEEMSEINEGMQDTLEKTSKMMAEVMEASLETMANVYSEIFTDEEIDRMIELHSDPVMQKLRENNPYIMQRAMTVVTTKMQEKLEEMMTEEGIDGMDFPIY